MNDSNVLSPDIDVTDQALDLVETTTSLDVAYQWHMDNGLEHVWAEEPVPYLDQQLVRELKAPIIDDIINSTLAPDGTAQEGTELERLYAEIQAFEGCDLKETAINTVIADGNSEADIMFVGEAPGADEDRQGKPFVGVSGQLLDKMMAAIGLDRTKVLITNTVFWRPPGNRKPTNAESLMCLDFTKRHIDLISPKIIVFVGALSAQKLLNTSDGITRIRGRWHPYTLSNGSQVQCMPMLHPAYLLRQPRYKRESWMDLLEVKKKMIEMGLNA